MEPLNLDHDVRVTYAARGIMKCMERLEKCFRSLLLTHSGDVEHVYPSIPSDPPI